MQERLKIIAERASNITSYHRLFSGVFALPVVCTSLLYTVPSILYVSMSVVLRVTGSTWRSEVAP